MKINKIISLFLAVGITCSSAAFSNSKAFAVSEVKSVVNNEQSQISLIQKARQAVKNAKEDLNEENIKSARCAIDDVSDPMVKKLLLELFNPVVDKNMDKNISTIDELIAANKQSEKIETCESNVKVTMNLEAKNLSEEKSQQLQQIASVVNSMVISMQSKVKGNANDGKALMESKVNASVMGMALDMNMWTDMDLNDNKIKYVIEMPEMLKMMLAPENQDLKYIVYDYAKVLEQISQLTNGNENTNSKDMLKMINKFSKKFSGNLNELIRFADARFNIVERKGTDEQGNKTYKLSLDSEKFSAVTKYILDNPQVKKGITDYMNNIMALYPEDVKEQLKMEDMNKALEMIKKFMEALNCDINIDYVVNKDGYVAAVNGTFKLTILPDEIKEVASKAVDNDDKKVEEKSQTVSNEQYIFTLNFDSTTDKINEEIEISTIPETDEKNSIDYMQLLMGQMKQVEEMKNIDEVEVTAPNSKVNN